MDKTAVKGPSLIQGFRMMFKKLTYPLFMCWIITAILNILFGFDTTSFGGVQNIPAFQNEFGTPIGENGSYALSASRASFMSSVAFAGKFLGALVCPCLPQRGEFMLVDLNLVCFSHN